MHAVHVHGDTSASLAQTTKLHPARSTGPSGHRVHVLNGGDSFFSRQGETLLEALIRQGLRSLPIGCVAGGCGICRIQIARGTYRKTGFVRRDHISLVDEQRGIYFACQTIALDDLEIVPLGRLAKTSRDAQDEVQRTHDRGET